jgi:hypothetical protein
MVEIGGFVGSREFDHPGSTWMPWAIAWPRARRSCSSSSRPTDFRHPKTRAFTGHKLEQSKPVEAKAPDSSREIR